MLPTPSRNTVWPPPCCVWSDKGRAVSDRCGSLSWRRPPHPEEMPMWHSTVECIVTLALSLLVMAPHTAMAQPSKIHRLGFLWNASPSLTYHWLEAFRQG